MVRTSKKSDIYDAALGAAIRMRRRAAGLTLQALAERCALSLQQVQKYETGSSRVPFSRLIQIARALGCSVSDLVRVFDGQTTRGRARLELFDRLTAAGAAELLEAYLALPPSARRPFVAFVQRTAGARAARGFGASGYEEPGVLTGGADADSLDTRAGPPALAAGIVPQADATGAASEDVRARQAHGRPRRRARPVCRSAAGNDRG